SLLWQPGLSRSGWNGKTRSIPSLVPNFFFKLLTFLSHQNFSTHTNFQLFRHIILILIKLLILK
ncbi:hypothetical protein M2T59_29645, partial [Klebsiella pneumoniae]|nr:hypothetical protein [Klebsiella pneumoniae]